MKKYILLVLLSLASLSVGAQKFLRYNMNNDTYNGFYTDGIESITHSFVNGIYTSIVQVSGKVYEIPLENIESISIEGINTDDEDVGEYRIYEVDYDEGDVKKIFVDNRASMFASRNGDFGANDTILYSSAYNGIAWLFFTDSQGRIKKVFNGEKLFFFDYSDENEVSVLDLSTDEVEHFQLSRENRSGSRQAINLKPVAEFFKELVTSTAVQKAVAQGVGSTVCTNTAKWLYDVQNNPESHHQAIIVDALAVGIDIAGIIGSIVAGVATGGVSWAALGIQAAFLTNDVLSLGRSIFPDSEQMEKYKQYYQNKYNITLTTLPADNISDKSATLHAKASSEDGFKGTFNFSLSEYSDSHYSLLPAAKQNVVNNTCDLIASTSILKPETRYTVIVKYDCVVDGLHFTYSGGVEFFKTKKKIPLQCESIDVDVRQFYDGEVRTMINANYGFPSNEEFDLSSYNSIGVCIKNKITGEESYHSYTENTLGVYVTLFEYIPKNQFTPDYSTFTATCDSYSFITYTTDWNGETTFYDEQVPKIVYDQKPSITITSCDIGETDRVDWKGRSCYRTKIKTYLSTSGTFWVKSADLDPFEHNDFIMDDYIDYIYVRGDGEGTFEWYLIYDVGVIGTDPFKYRFYLTLDNDKQVSSTNIISLWGKPSITNYELSDNANARSGKPKSRQSLMIPNKDKGQAKVISLTKEIK